MRLEATLSRGQKWTRSACCSRPGAVLAALFLAIGAMACTNDSDSSAPSSVTDGAEATDLCSTLELLTEQAAEFGEGFPEEPLPDSEWASFQAARAELLDQTLAQLDGVTDVPDEMRSALTLFETSVRTDGEITADAENWQQATDEMNEWRTSNPGAIPAEYRLASYGTLVCGIRSDGQSETAAELAVGEGLYGHFCSSCHGTDGLGSSTGPEVASEVLLTFPDAMEELEFVRLGSSGLTDAGETSYGDPDRPGGQRSVEGGMPPFDDALTDAEIEAIIRYEREVLSAN